MYTWRCNKVQSNHFFSSSLLPKVSEYDQEIAQLHTADQTMAPRGRATEHKQYIRHSRFTIINTSHYHHHVTISHILSISCSFNGYVLY